MMGWIIGTSLRFRFVVIAIGVCLMYFGVLRLNDMPVDVFPEFAPAKVEIQTIALGLSPSEVESLITVPLENALAGVPGVATLRSKSVPQLSSVVAIFEPGVDELLTRQLVTERVAMATPNLPRWAAPPFMMPPLSSTSRVMKIGITSTDHSVMDLSMLAYWTIRARLLGVPGVANIAIWGEQLKMVQVQVDLERMAIHQVTLDDIQEAVSDSLDVGLLRYSTGAHIGTGGFIETPDQRFEILLTSSSQTPETLAQVPITVRNGAPLLLGDVADIAFGPQAPIGDAVINDGPGLMLIVEKFPWGNTLEVTLGVEAALDAMKPGLPGVEIDTEIFRPATFIEDSINNLSNALLLGCLLVILVMVAFLYEWRAALIATVAIPLSLLSAGLVIAMTGVSMNTMVLAGFVIAIGAVVDDAIIDIENILRRVRIEHAAGSKRSLARIILEASLEVRRPIIYATLIVVMAVMPVLFMEGLSGAFFKPLVMSYVLAIISSLLVAITVTPALGLILLRNAPLTGRQSPLVKWLSSGYMTLLTKTTRGPTLALSIVAIVTACGIALWPLLGHSLLPSFKERDFLMHWVTPPGTSHSEMVRITTRASKELRAIPGVRNFGAHIGQAFAADEVVGINFGENWISISPDVDYAQTIAAVDEMVKGYPGLYRDLQTYLKERIREVLTGSGEAIVVRLFGTDLEVLRAKADEVQQAMAGVEGMEHLHKELIVEVPEIQVTLNLDVALRYGLKPGDVRRASAAFLAGEEVGDIFNTGRTYDVQVWTLPKWRNSLTALQNMMIDTPTGERVRLVDVADINIVPSPNIIKREGGSRRIDVHANVTGRDLESVAQDVQRRVDEIDFPIGYRAVLQGEYIELKAARERILFFSGFALIAILLLLQLTFRSWRLAWISMLTLPFALVGGVVAAYIAGGVVSLGSLVGFLTVLGIAARNGIMMLCHFQHLEQHENEPFGIPLVLRGAKERLSPILMTAGASGFAVLPLVLFGNLPGHEIEYPMAVVILGGLFTSTLLNLFIVPTLYLRFGQGTAKGSEENSHLALASG
ncbi:efflux RND transporter permease subunit [Reinekea sp.]|jgi:CzcA family heavy metal efflux pump|uniref:efflux RND transporter permease subunit n=1 Tax=Reinekea sp. TaxID=1970455 RepID=UPI002A8334BF|nr:efflux RND transporter permease subunit [Reinekea sp.]